MSQVTRLAWNPTTNSTFTNRHFFFNNNCVGCEPEISRSPDIAMHNYCLIVSSISLTLVTNVGSSNDNPPYLSSPKNEVRPFQNRPCHLNINVRLHYHLTLKTHISNGSVGDFPDLSHRLSPQLLF